MLLIGLVVVVVVADCQHEADCNRTAEVARVGVQLPLEVYEDDVFTTDQYVGTAVLDLRGIWCPPPQLGLSHSLHTSHTTLVLPIPTSAPQCSRNPQRNLHPQHCLTPHTSTSLSQPQPHAAHLSYSLMLYLTPLPHPLDLCLHHCSISHLYLTFRRLPDSPQLSHSLNIYLTPYTSIPRPTPAPHSAHLHLTLLDTSPSTLNPQLPASPTSTHPRLTSHLAVALPLAARRR